MDPNKNYYLKGVVLDENHEILQQDGKIFVELVDNEGKIFNSWIPAVELGFDINFENRDEDSMKENINLNNGLKTEMVAQKSIEMLDMDNGECNKIEKWTEPAATMLMDLYCTYLSDVGPYKKFKTKLCMMQKISEDMNKELGLQLTRDKVSNKIKSIINNHKKTKKHNQSTGRDRKTLLFQEQMSKIEAIDDSLEPEVLMGVGRVEFSDKKLKFAKETTNKKLQANEVQEKKSISKNITQCIAETLFLLNEQKEKKKEERHQEKLAILRAFFGQSEKKRKHSDDSASD